jgi:hypothetical protein
LRELCYPDFDYEPLLFELGNSFFISNELKEQLIEGCNEVVAFKEDSFKSLTNKDIRIKQ